jgi:ABC-type multidrug transport system fused ATPase/permease subunit
MNSSVKVWKLLTPKQHRVAAALLGLMLIGMVMEMAGIGLVIPLIALVSERDLAASYPSLTPWLERQGNPSHDRLVTAGMFALVGIYTMKALYLGFLSSRQSRFVFSVQADLSQRLFSTYLQQPYSFHLQRNSAQLIRNTINEVDQARWVIQTGLSLAAEFLVLVGLAAILLAVEFLGTVLVVGTLGLAVYGFQRLTRDRIMRWGVARQEYEGLRLQHLQQGLGSAKEVKLLGREGEFLARYWAYNNGNAQIGQRQATLEALPKLWLELLAVVGLAALVLVMIVQGKPLDRVLPTLGLFAAVAFRLLPSVNRMLSGAQRVRFFLPVIDNLYSELHDLSIPQSVQERTRFPFHHALEIEQVGFRYPNAETLSLRKVSAVISCGSSVGFIGTTGAGKSTLVDIILGLLTPGEGAVKIDGIDIQTNLRGWQAQIGYVPQSIYLTDDTLRRNVALGLPDAQISEIEISRAIRAAQLDQFVRELPEGLETKVGERGVRLSGGQRQRIGIARALYHDPSVLVLDEATSALDTATEQAVMEGIRALKGKKTIIIVAHRLSTVEHCDRVFRFEKGCLVQGGEPALLTETRLGETSDSGHE